MVKANAIQTTVPASPDVAYTTEKFLLQVAAIRIKVDDERYLDFLKLCNSGRSEYSPVTSHHR